MKNLMALCALAFAACVPASEVDVEDTQQAIINGVASESPEDDAAVGLGGTGVCSGVLIAPNLVATANHCVARNNPKPAACDGNGVAVSGGEIYGYIDPAKVGVLVGNMGKSMYDAMGKEIFHPDFDNLCNHDLAIVLLDRDIPNAKIAKLRLNSPPVPGDMVYAVGWGTSNTHKGRNRRDNIEITSLGPNTDLWIAPNEFGTGEAICSGDSGGPIFDQKTGSLLGITSRGGNQGGPSASDPTKLCRDLPGLPVTNYYTRIDKFRDVFDKAFAASGHKPIIEGEDAMVGTRMDPNCGANCMQAKGCSVGGGSDQAAFTLVAVLLALVVLRRRAAWMMLLVGACEPDVGRHPDDETTRTDPTGIYTCSEDAKKYVYTLDKDYTLSRFDPKTYGFADIGKLACPAVKDATPFSMSIDRSATAWVIYNSGELFKVSTHDAKCTATTYSESEKGLDIFGMGFVAEDDTHREYLYVAGGPKDADRTGPSKLASIDTETLAVSNVGPVNAWPELTGTGDGKLWGFFPSMSQPRVSQLSRTTGKETNAMALPEIAGKPMSWAFAFWGGEFFIFLKRPMEAGTVVYKLTPKVGRATAVKNSTRTIVGAGVSTCAPVEIL